MVGANFTETLLNGGQNQQGNYPASEGNLDIQYAVALAAAHVDVRFYSVGGRNLEFIPDLEYVFLLPFPVRLLSSRQPELT